MEEIFRRTARRALAALFPRSASRPEVEIALLPNVALRRLKWRLLRKRARVVDVLAFPHPKSFPAPDRQGAFLGEVYVNSAIARRDLRRARYLLVHGILHLAGFRHDRRRDTIMMERMERSILEHVRKPRRPRYEPDAARSRNDDAGVP